MIGEDSMKKKKQTTLAVAIIIMVAAAIVAYAVYTVISAKPSNWQVEDRLSNTGTQDTTEFEMNNTWRIDWKINEQYDPFFVIVVFIKNATGYSSVAGSQRNRHKHYTRNPTRALHRHLRHPRTHAR